MAYTTRSIVTVLSAVLLLALMALAGYALHLNNYYSLPISTALSALTVALPAIAGLSVETTTQLRRQQRAITGGKPSQARSSLVSIATYGLLILETVVATLSGTHLAPSSSLTCGLNTEWLRLFRAKNADTIQRIQNAFNCCGLHSVADMAYPFPAKDVSAKTCSIRYDRQKSCFGDLRQQEQKAAAIMLAVTVIVALWQILVVANPLGRENATWLHDVLPTNGPSGRRRVPQRAIDYPEAQRQYRDDPEDREATNSTDAELGADTSRPRNETTDSVPPRGRMHPSGLGHSAEEGWGQSEER